MDLNQLYKPFDPDQRQQVVFEKVFQPGDTYIGLRPFYIPDDFRLYNEWMKKHIVVGADRVDTGAIFSESYFRALLKSSNAQSFCGLVNMEPAFQVDLFTSLYYTEDSIDGIDLGPQDVIMQIVMSPGLMTNTRLAGHALSGCMEYLAAFPALRRMFWAIGSDYQYYNKVIRKARLHWWPLAGHGKDVCGYTLGPKT